MKIEIKPKYDCCNGLVLQVYIVGNDKPFLNINVEDVIVGAAQKTLDERRRIYYNERDNFNEITNALRSIAKKHKKVVDKIWTRYYF